MYYSSNRRYVFVDAPDYVMFDSNIQWLAAVDTIEENINNQYIICGITTGASSNRFYSVASSAGRYDVTIPSQARNSGAQSLFGGPQILNTFMTNASPDNKFGVGNVNLTDIGGPLSGTTTPVNRASADVGKSFPDSGFSIGARISSPTALGFLSGIDWVVQLSTVLSSDDVNDIAGGKKTILDDFSDDILFLADFSKPLGTDPYSGFSLSLYNPDGVVGVLDSNTILPLSRAPFSSSFFTLTIQGVSCSLDITTLFPKPKYTDNGSYSVTGILPTGTSYNAVTKKIEGTPTQGAEISSFTVSLNGKSVAVTFLVVGKNVSLSGDRIRELSQSLYGRPMQYNDFLRAYFKDLYHKPPHVVSDSLMKHLQEIEYKHK